jgi:hypothetical protein
MIRLLPLNHFERQTATGRERLFNNSPIGSSPVSALPIQKPGKAFNPVIFHVPATFTFIQEFDNTFVLSNPGLHVLLTAKSLILRFRIAVSQNKV